MGLVLQSSDAVTASKPPPVDPPTTEQNDPCPSRPAASSPSPPGVNYRTFHEHATDLIVLNALDRYRSCSQNDNDEEEDIASTRKRVLNSRKTRRRFIFNEYKPPGNDAVLDLPWKIESILDCSDVRLGNRMWAETLADFYYLSDDRGTLSASVLRTYFFASFQKHGTFGSFYKFLQGEASQQVVPVYSVSKLIREIESWVVSNVEPPKLLKDLDAETLSALQPTDEEQPPASCFSPSSYPAPWPFEPFRAQDWHPQEKLFNFTHIPTLQEYIPRHLLPKTLVVHDPWGLIHVTGSRGESACSWGEMDDIVHTYKLANCSVPDGRCEQDVKAEENLIKEQQAKIDAFLSKPHSDTPMPDGMLLDPPQVTPTLCGPAKPPVYIVFPPKPLPRAAEEAHLYLSKAARLGVGHHSYVYRAEFEIPRSLVVDELLCKECVMSDVKRILEEQDGIHGELRDAKWEEYSGRYVLRVRGTRATTRKFGDREYEVRGDTREAMVEYEGPYRAIETTVKYQSLERAPYCKHLRDDNVHPLTAKTRVAAKLSLQYDTQIRAEAKNYQRFPKHFFEHNNGFSIMPPFTKPIPLGAVVPQFYGYYEIDREKSTVSNYAYCSPILLVEDCGKSISPDELSTEELDECLSLLYRMHDEGWLHGSVYCRNIVWQAGPLSAHPIMRQMDEYPTAKGHLWGRQRSFRLIDFGRSGTMESLDDYEDDMEYDERKVEGLRLRRRILE
ncbi:hypothetical protein CPC08DRAFT_304843 [Agrocybe pediades]|nr:hypothetical protein CPC08DRAFT_304843 [Agrocybe pediades]